MLPVIGAGGGNFERVGGAPLATPMPKLSTPVPAKKAAPATKEPHANG